MATTKSKKPAAKSKSKSKPKPKAKPKTTNTVKPPTVAQLTKQYQQLKKSGTFRSSCEGQAFFYEACWSDDAELEAEFDAFCNSTQAARNDKDEPMDLYEERLVNEGCFTELQSFFAGLSAEQLKRALPMMQQFLANPKRRPRYEATQE